MIFFCNRIAGFVPFFKNLVLQPFISIFHTKKKFSSLSWEDNDPHFYLRKSLFSLPLFHGYYIIEYGCDSSTRMLSRFYVDYGEGFSEEESFALISRTGDVSKRVVYFKKNVKRIRWDPSETPGVITKPTFSFVRLTNQRALHHIRKKLSRISTESSNILNFLDLDSEVLWKTYDTHFERQCITQDYEGWIYEQEAALWAAHVNQSAILFSIIMPVYNTSPRLLSAAVKSVLNQTYTHWQLILVDDASEDIQTLDYLSKVKKMDSRILVIRRQFNGHIAASTNDGIDVSDGTFTVFMDHDDMLAPQALNELATIIDQEPHLDFLYSDEDLMSDDGTRCSPHFKPDWNPDLLLSHNYITHLTCIRSSLLKEMNGIRPGFDGAQDFDLMLRVLDRVPTNRIKHIPKVLYHWRMTEGSTASDSSAKSYATEAGLNALKDYARRNGTEALVEHDTRDNFYRMIWPLPKTLPRVSIIIPTRDGLTVLKPCVESILATIGDYPCEIVIVDNGSVQPETIDYFSSLQEDSSKVAVNIVSDPGDFNFSRLINLGAEHASGELLLLLNNDTEAISPGWLEEMVRHVVRKDIGCVGAKLLYPDMTIQHAGVILGLGGYAAHSHRGLDRYAPGYVARAQIVQNLSAVTAACLMIRKSVFLSVGGFDEEFRVAYNDVDFCLRVRQAGFRNLYTPYAELIHHESKTRGHDLSPEKQKRFDNEKNLLSSRWSQELQNDPYYSPNLTRDREDFSLR